MTKGVSIMWPSPMPSCMSEKPGPDVAVMAFAPARLAPTRAHTELISSSNWIARTSGRLTRYCRTSEAGVMG